MIVISGAYLPSMRGAFHLLEQHNAGCVVVQRLERAGIFALIAGTFTPVHTIFPEEFWRRGPLILIWSLAISGIALKSIYFDDLAEWTGLVAYRGPGWPGILSA
jgi:channel protein (hemolysin III family)